MRLLQLAPTIAFCNLMLFLKVLRENYGKRPPCAGKKDSVDNHKAALGTARAGSSFFTHGGVKIPTSAASVDEKQRPFYAVPLQGYRARVRVRDVSLKTINLGKVKSIRSEN